jgi:topoisomerase-4 subunit A
MGLKAVLKAYLDHRREVLIRRSQFRLDKIEKRLHLLDGYLIAYLNIDEVIRIIREEDHPKDVMMQRFGITEIQAEAVLNLRLRALRKLEEMEIRGEHDKLTEERSEIIALLGSESRQWTKVKKELRAAREVFSPESDLGRRRAKFGEAPVIDVDAALEASMPKEPVTVVLSSMGWIRGMKGHGIDLDSAKFKDGDSLLLSEEVYTTDKLILMASDGRAFTLGCDSLPGGRGHGEPIRISIDLEDSVEIVGMFKLIPSRKRIVASSAGYGFIVQESELESNRKAGKSAVNVPTGSTLQICDVVRGDHVAVIGTNKKLLIFPLDELPEMARGKGNKLQNYRGTDKLGDVIVFDGEDGLIVTDSAGRMRGFPEWKDWLGKRAQAGKTVMKGFPRSGKFSG